MNVNERQTDRPVSIDRTMCPIYCIYHVKVNGVHLLKRLSSSGYVHVLVDKCALLSANDHHSARLIAAILPLTSIILRFSPRRTTYHHQSPEPQRTRSHAHKHYSKNNKQQLWSVRQTTCSGEEGSPSFIYSLRLP